MIPLEDALDRLFTLSAARNHAVLPAGLTAAFDAVPDGPVMTGETDTDQAIFDAFRAEYPAVYGEVVGPMTPAQWESWADFICWVTQLLVAWDPQEDRARTRLRIVLLCLHTMDYRLLWPRMDAAIGNNTALITFLAQVVAGTRFDTLENPGTRHVPGNQPDLLERAEMGQVSSISEVLSNHSLDTLIPQPMLDQAVRALARFDQAGLVRTIVLHRHFLLAHVLSSAVSPAKGLEIGARTLTPPQRFTLVYQIAANPAILLDAEMEETILDVIVWASRDLETWRAWISVFLGSYHRFRSCQGVLGAALARVDEAAVIAFCDAIPINVEQEIPIAPLGEPEFEVVSVCFAAFRRYADADRRAFVWKLMYDKWVAADFELRQTGATLVAISRTSIDYAVVGYFVECESPQRLIDMQAKLVSTVATWPSDWFPTLSDCLGGRFKELSRLQVVVHAMDVLQTGTGWCRRRGVQHLVDAGFKEYNSVKYR